MNLPKARYKVYSHMHRAAFHRTPGRIRVRIPSAKGDTEFLEEARAALAALPGVIEVSSNPLTGSLLILHLPEVELDLEGATGSHNGGSLPFVVEKPSNPGPAPQRRKFRNGPRQSLVAHAIAESATNLDDAVRDATGDVLDLKVLLPIVVGGLALSFIGGPSRSAPIWLPLIIFAFSSFLSLHGGFDLYQDAEEGSSLDAVE